ncbi:hypothetical protein PRNP1_003684 [Phytophthora ramorum]
MVRTYSAARRDMGLGRTSSPDTFRRLEWNLSNTIESNKQQMKLDKMAGRLFYFKLMTAIGPTDRQLNLFNNAMDSVPAADVTRVHELVLRLADGVDIKFDEQRSRSFTPTMHIGPFAFSAAGILRYAAAA